MISYWPNAEGVDLPTFPDGTDLLVINQRYPHVQDAGKLVKALAENRSRLAKILIYSRYEPSDWDYLTMLESVATAFGMADRIAVYDAGEPVEAFGNLKTIITFPTWIWNFFGEITLPAFEHRTTKFVCLNRKARPYKVKFVEGLIRASLAEEGLITCGSGSPNFPFASIVPPDLAQLFPLAPLGDARHIDWRTPLPEALNCLINVICEGSYDKMGDYLKEHSWERAMFSEKSTKAYLGMQLPIWVATTNFVAYQRKLGFDVFDDLIDHSYDTIIDPAQRMQQVTIEVKKLVNRPLSELQLLLKANEERLQKNKEMVSIVHSREKKIAWQRLLAWLKA